MLIGSHRPDTDDAYNLDKTALQSALSDSSNAGAVYAITVGSEALYRGSLTAQALLSKINDMQSTFPSMKIGTADSWNKFQDGTADPIIKGGLKLMYILLWYDDEIATDIVNSLANAFSYWQGQTLANSSHSYLDDLNQAYGHIQTVAGSLDIVEIWNGETGWPTDGLSHLLSIYTSKLIVSHRRNQLRIRHGRHPERSDILSTGRLCRSRLGLQCLLL